jgi:hypothetical protein
MVMNIQVVVLQAVTLHSNVAEYRMFPRWFKKEFKIHNNEVKFHSKIIK